MSHFYQRLCVGVLLVALTLVAQAQDDTPDFHPLIEMMLLVPAEVDTPNYTDYSALANAGSTSLTVENFEADVLESETNGTLWIDRSVRLSTGLDLGFLIVGAPQMPETVGFDFAAIERTMTYNFPPAQGVVLAGDFDTEAVTAAHLNRDYVETTVAGVPAVCGNQACDDGLTPDLGGRAQGNIFDPQLGRKAPILLGDGVLLSAFAPDVVTELAQVAQRNRPALIDNPPYAAIALTLTDVELLAAELVQLQFYTLDDLPDGRTDLTQFESETAYQAALDEGTRLPPLDDLLSYGDLPEYEVLALADFHDGSQQTAVLALAYGALADAEIAATELQMRLQGFSADRVASLNEAGLSTSISEPLVYEDAETGYAVALVTISYPLVDDTTVPPATFFTQWQQSVFSSTFYPVWSLTLPEWVTTG